MSKKNIFGTVVCMTLFLVLLNAGGTKEESMRESKISNAVGRFFIRPARTSKPFFFTKRGRLARELYNYTDRASSGYDPELVLDVLQRGADPNYCRGENGWAETHPIYVVVKGFNSTFHNIPEMTLDGDVQALRYLVDFGANINALPYVWRRVTRFALKESYYRQWNLDSRNFNLEEKRTYIAAVEKRYIEDANRLLIALLELGADPDMRGHPYPFSYEAMYKMNDAKAAEYFAKGTRPINEAIKKGIMWESQVDILLRYTNLDEDSLVAAQESGDPQMIEKIQRLWEAQTTQ